MNRDALIEFYKKHVTYLTVTPVLVTVAIALASIIISGIIERNLTTVQAQAVNKQIRENRLLLQNTFESYSQIAWSGVGRVNSGEVSRESWQKFVGTYKFNERFPAIYSLGLTKVVNPDEKADITARLSEEYGQEIKILQDNDSKPVNILAYTSPERETSVSNIGLNINSNANRAEAMRRASDNNIIAMTDQLNLIVDAKRQKTLSESAFLMYAPYYADDMPLDTVEQRRDALRGYVSASFISNEFFKQAFSRVDHSHVSVAVHMGNDSKNRPQVYASKATSQSGPQIARSQTIQVYGQTFVIDYAFNSDYLVSITQLKSPLYTVLFGMLTALLVGTVTYFFLRGRHHLLLLDKERDVTRAKDELLSLASHQLRTPATGVKQYMGMVLQGFAGPITDTQKEFLEKAYKSNERQLHVINDILHLAKLDLGRIVLAKTSFDLAELVRDIVEEQQQSLDAGNLTLTTKVLKKAPVYADSHMIRMVIENILSNAIKYTDPKGKVSVRLSHSGEYYAVIIKDTGVGIALEDTPRLFKQFSRLNNPRSHVVTGTGVGLYLAKNLVELHEGDITVESVVGKGSTFTVLIPKNPEKL